MEVNFEWPKVSICMPTYDRNKFMPLIAQNLRGFQYDDKSKLEFVVDDDGSRPMFPDDDSKNEFIELIAPIRLNYNYYNKRRSIGAKRNNLVKIASHKYLIMMDSDDIYMPTYIQYSMHCLKQGNFGLVGTNAMLFLYPHNDFKITAIQCAAKRQIHEASMCFTKKHWKSMGGFAKNSRGEGARMVDHNDNRCGLTDIRLCMICLCHQSNTISKDLFKDKDICEGQLSPMIKKIIADICDIKLNNESHQDQSHIEEEVLPLGRPHLDGDHNNQSVAQ